MSEQKLFNDFPPVTTEQWEEKIKQDLKGADYEKNLISKTTDGIKIKPYYRKEDLSNLKYLQTLPGQFPYTRSTKTKDNNFDVRQNIFVEDFNSANKKALTAIDAGANSIGFYICHKETVKQAEFDTLINGINPENTMLNFFSGKISSDILKFFLSGIKKNKFKQEKVKASFDFDPLGYKTITGNSFNKGNIEKDFAILKEMIDLTGDKYPLIKLLNINGIFFANAGALSTQELGFVLASANETLALAEKKGINIETLIPKMIFTFGIGSDYFIEIAKLRAARLLWAKIVETWTTKKEISKLFINSVTSDWNKTIYDPYVNQLRNTTEAMSAVIGSTNSLTVKPFDATYKKPDELSERIARNTGIILKEEAYFDKAIDPAAGSYYIENLTNDIVENAWKIFLNIEEAGGYDEALKKKIIQNRITETAQKRDLNIAFRKEILLGTNQYPNLNEKVNEDIDYSIYSWNLPEEKNTDIEPIKFYRGAKKFEDLRLATEKSDKKPKVFLFPYGNLAIRKARASFSLNFFACAGYEIIDNAGFKTLEEGTKAALNSKADIVVICSSDEEYLSIAPEIYKKLRGKAITVIAGYPKNSIEKLQSIGIKYFIHVISNISETLQHFNKLLNIK